LTFGIDSVAGRPIWPGSRTPVGPRREVLDIPPLQRQHLKKVVNGMDFSVLESDLDTMDLDTPTFLRRQAD
jgi:hypothetical protein